ncbi:MAG: hypothetical protein ACJ75J_15525 [Cytophagaceae bacterium]
MKIAIIVLGILGSISSFGLGSIWFSDYNKSKDILEQGKALAGSNPELLASIEGAESAGRASYLLLIGGLLALVATFMVPKLGKKAAIALVVIALAPAVLAPKALAGTFFILVAGILAFLAKPKEAAPTV